MIRARRLINGTGDLQISSTAAPRFWTVVHVLTLALAIGVLAVANRGQWFFGDEWDFLASRGIGDPAMTIWRPHNEHWSTIPVLIYVGLRNSVGLGSYWPFIGVLIAAHVALAHVLWRVAVRAGASLAVATAGALLFALLGAGYENLLWAFQIGFVGSLLLGWLAVLVGDRPGGLGRSDVGAIVLLVGSLMCSGIGVPMVATAAVAVLARSRNWLRTAVVGGVPTVVFLIWYALIGNINQHATPGDDAPLLHLFTNVRAGIVSIAEGTTSLPPALAKLALLSLGAWWVLRAVGVVRDAPGARQETIALVGLPGAVVFLCIVGLGRGGLDSSRYVYVATALAIPAVILAMGRLGRPWWLQSVAVVALLSVTWQNVHVLGTYSGAEADREQQVRAIVMAAANMSEGAATFLGQQPEPVHDPDITMTALRRLVEKNGLPTGPVTVAAKNSVLLAVEVAISASDSEPQPGDPPRAVSEVDVQQSVGSAGVPCWVPVAAAVAPHIVVVGDGLPSSLGLVAPAGSAFGIQIGEGSDETGVRSLSVVDGRATNLEFDLPAGTMMTVHLPATGGAVCGVQ